MGFRRILGTLLGMVLPRSGAAPDAPAAPAGDGGELARQLEEANARVRELEGITEEKVRARAEELVTEIFPQTQVPDPEVRRVERTDPPAAGDPPADPTSPEALRADVDALKREMTEKEIADGAAALERQLDALERQYPHLDRFRILGQMAQARGPVDVERLARASHNVNHQRLEDYAAQKIAALGNPAAQPPPVPPGPAGAPVSGDKITTKSSASVFAARLAAKGFGTAGS